MDCRPEELLVTTVEEISTLTRPNHPDDWTDVDSLAVDTVRVEAAQLLAQHGDKSSSVDPSKIWVPSPYWNFDWP